MRLDPFHPDPQLIALGVKQPWIELILRGVKKVEVRTMPTAIRGTIYLYASQTFAAGPPVETVVERHDLPIKELPRGLIIGTVEITDCRPCQEDDAAAAQLPANLLMGKQAWLLENPRRLKTPLKPRFLPYGVWFYPFRRRNDSSGVPSGSNDHG